MPGTLCRPAAQIGLSNQKLTDSSCHAGGLAPLAVRSYWLRFPSFVSITRGFPMKAWIPLTLVFAFGLAAHAQATCVYPQAPAPNGATASRDEMIAAKHDFDRYNGEMNVYLDCLNLEMDATPKDVTKMTPDEKKKADQEQKALVQKHNAAVDELQAVVGKFNEQLKIFKAKQK